MEKNIMVAFVSIVSMKSVDMPVEYDDVHGLPYVAVQTNESAVAWLERAYAANPLDRIFLIVSNEVKNGFVPEGKGNTFGKITHLDFLKRRLIVKFPDLKGKFVEFDYTEGNSNSSYEEKHHQQELSQNLLDVAKISDGILEYVKEFSNYRIVLHADMTGGMRHASMMMLSIIQLLIYHGIEIGDVLYSDPSQKRVYQATPIQRMFTLINGANEFVKFGSVTSISEYFRPIDNKSEPLKELLNAMENFSNAVSICNTGMILNEVKNLGVKLEVFHKFKTKTIQEELFDRINGTIRKEYGNLLKSNVGRIDIIRWCMGKGLWQQTLTLCTEWLPEYIVDHRIAYTDSREVQERCMTGKKNRGRNWKQIFVIDYNGIADRSFAEKSKIKEIKAWMSESCESGRIDVSTVPKESPKLKQIAGDYLNGRGLYENFRNGKLRGKEFENKLPGFYTLLNLIYSGKKNSGTYKKTFREFVCGMKYGELWNNVKTFSNETIKSLLETDNDDAMEFVKGRYKSADLEVEGSTKWKNRSKDYRNMYQSGILKTDLNNAREMMECLHAYHEIRELRNLINHAVQNGDDIPIREIIKKVDMCLTHLEGAAQSVSQCDAIHR